jgi:hypothetical protein
LGLAFDLFIEDEASGIEWIFATTEKKAENKSNFCCKESYSE